MSCPSIYNCLSPRLTPCEISWEIFPSGEILHGDYATALISGLSPNQKVGVRVIKPDEKVYIWHLQANDSGIVDAKLKLDAGNGSYIFVPCIPCCDVLPQSICVNVANCVIPPKRICDVKVESSRQRILGSETEITFSNLAPKRLCMITIHEVLTNQDSTHHVFSDVNGVAIFDFNPPAPRITEYIIKISDGTCVSPPHTVAYNAATNTPGTLPPVVVGCENAVNFTAKFDKTAYKPGETGTVFITVCNRSNIPQTVNYTLQGDVHEDLIFYTDPIFNATILPADCRDFAFTFTIAHSATAAPLRLTWKGSYTCGGNTYVSPTNMAIATIAQSNASCGIAVTSWYFKPSTVAVGQYTKLGLVVQNTGTAAVTDLQLLSGVLPAGLNSTLIGFSGISIAPGQSHQYTVNVKATSAANYTIALDASDVLALCSGNTILGNASTLNANVAVIVPAPSPAPTPAPSPTTPPTSVLVT